MVNEELFLDIHNKRFFDFKKLNEIQQKHSNILVINPWIEFINYEFIATRHLIIKEDKNFLFSKSFYLFINNQEFKNKLIRGLESYGNDLLNIHYFGENENFERPITFCFLVDYNKNLIFKLEIHQFKCEYEDFSIDSLKTEKNFVYFYKVLKSIEEHFIEHFKIENKFVKNTIVNNLKIHASFCI